MCEEDDIADYFSNPEICPLVPRDLRFPRDTAPAYITPRVSLADYLQSEGLYPSINDMTVKILGFGRGTAGLEGGR